MPSARTGLIAISVISVGSIIGVHYMQTMEQAVRAALPRSRLAPPRPSTPPRH